MTRFVTSLDKPINLDPLRNEVCTPTRSVRIGSDRKLHILSCVPNDKTCFSCNCKVSHVRIIYHELHKGQYQGFQLLQSLLVWEF